VLRRGGAVEIPTATGGVVGTGGEHELTDRRWEGLGTLGSILRPRYTDFEEKVVSADVGTGGPGTRMIARRSGKDVRSDDVPGPHKPIEARSKS